MTTLLEQAITAYGARLGGISPIVSVRRAGRDSFDVETAGAVVRITAYPGGLVGLVGWHRHGSERGPERVAGRQWNASSYRVLTGVYTSAGWACKVETYTDVQFSGIKSRLPR